MFSDKPLIDILLPTWNGERFLREQLDTLLGQQDVTMRILLRDDSSDDGTWRVAQAYASVHENMFLDRGTRLGVVENVGKLLDISNAEGNAPYFALCDQDDIWYPHKLAASMEAMEQLERRHSPATPLLVCADARCVDCEGHLLHSSFLGSLGVSASWGRDLREVLIMSHALGCTCLGNAALRRRALPMPEASEVFMHDWWLLLVASCFGAVYCIAEPLLDYRQHESNQLGAKGKNTGFVHRLTMSRKHSRRTQRQARTLLQRFAEDLDPGALRKTRAWAEMPDRPWWKRQWLCHRSGFSKPGWGRFFT